MKNKDLQQKLEQARKLIDECLAAISSTKGLNEGKKAISVQSDTVNIEDIILSIVNKIGDCDESEEIQSKVLDQMNMEGKILLCFFISSKYFKNTWLTTGDIEKITSALGTKVAVGNVSNKIKAGLRQYLESGAVRKRGQPTPYRLNRKGVKRFNEIIHAA